MELVIVSPREFVTNIRDVLKPGFILSAIATAACVLTLNYLYPINGPEAPFMPVFVGCSLTMIACGLALGLFTRPLWPMVLFGFAGISAAVVAYAFYDFSVNHIEHNLFPIEILILAILLMPGLVVGVTSAAAVNRLRRR
jgi:hypothetical protein